MFENCFPADMRHNLWEICAKGRVHSGLYNLNLVQILRKVVKPHIVVQMPGVNLQTCSGIKTCCHFVRLARRPMIFHKDGKS